MTSLNFINLVNFFMSCLIKFYLTYYLIGILSCAFFEFLINKVKNVLNDKIRSITWTDRFWYTNLWPSFLTFFFITIFKTLKSKGND